MRFTPGQLRDIVGVSQETLRHWRSSLRPLQGVKGRSPCFNPGQLLGSSVVKVLVGDCGVSVGSIGNAAVALFNTCSHPNWNDLAHKRIALDLRAGTAVLFDVDAAPPAASSLILIAMSPIIERVRSKILNAPAEHGQAALQFPPMSITRSHSAATSRRRS